MAEFVVFVAAETSCDGGVDSVYWGVTNPSAGGIKVYRDDDFDKELPPASAKPDLIVVFDSGLPLDRVKDDLGHSPERAGAVPGEADWSGFALYLVPFSRNRRSPGPLYWRDGWVYLDSHFRCLIAADELDDARSRASLIRFETELRVAGTDEGGRPLVQLHRLSLGERRPRHRLAGEFTGTLGEVARPGGPPSAVLRRWGVRGGGWEAGAIELSVTPALAAPAGGPGAVKLSKLRTLRLTRRFQRIGPGAGLGMFGLRAESGDWLTFTQRPQFDWPRSVMLPRLRRDRELTPQEARRSSVLWALEMEYDEAPPSRAQALQPRCGPHRILDAWNRSVGRHVQSALEVTVPGAAVSFIPELCPRPRFPYYSGGDWVVLGMVNDRHPREATLWFKPGEQDIFPPTVQPKSLDPQHVAPKFPVRAVFKGLTLHDGTCLTLDGEIVSRRNADPRSPSAGQRAQEMECDDRGSFTFDLVLHQPASDPEGDPASVSPPTLRIGSLDLTVGDLSTGLARGGAGTALDRARKYPTDQYRSQFDAVIRQWTDEPDALRSLVALPLLDAVPGAQDPPPRAFSAGRDFEATASWDPADEEVRTRTRFRREDPIVLARSRRPPATLGSGAAVFLLRARDNFDRTENRQRALSLNLFRDPNSGPVARPRQPRQRVVVLDRQPLLIAQVETTGLGGIEGPDPDLLEIGSWSSDAAEAPAWQLRGTPEGFDLVLPSQTIGEAMERGKDLREGGAIGTTPGIDWRLSPPARFSLLSSYNPRRFPEAAWNLRRVLGYPGQRAPGAGVLRLEFELLYGMSCEVRTVMRPPPIRLAELSSRIGAIPSSLPRDAVWWPGRRDHPLSAHYARYRRQWSRLFAAYLSRLGVLQPYSDQQPEGLLLESDVIFRLRRTADLAYPVQGGAAPAATEAPLGTLRGGVSWGFESAAVYEELWSNPVSTAAKLVNPAFSSLGGWGYQKASFSQGKQIIHSNTSMGRVFYYSLERIGRVGCLWNHAKHVVVYERSVVPSAQFVPPGPAALDYQNPLLGRAVLRKVREYVEVTEPVRKIPESGADPKTSGCVRGSHFKTTVMAVNSRRLTDLREGDRYIGYTIPLWHPDDERANPTVYPRPQIDIRCASADGSNQDVGCEFDDPSQLVFFSSTRSEDKDNPSTWAPVHGVDCVDVPMCHEPDLDGFDAGAAEGDLADAPQIEPGYERFTFKLRPPDRLVNLAAARVAEGENTATAAGAAAAAIIGAKLHNVTVMRARVVGVVPEATALVRNKINEATAVFNRAADNVQHALDQAEAFHSNLLREAERLKEETEGFDAEGYINSKLGEVKRRVESAIAKPERQIRRAVGDILREVPVSGTLLRPIIDPNFLCIAVDRELSAIEDGLRARLNSAIEGFLGAASTQAKVLWQAQLSRSQQTVADFVRAFDDMWARIRYELYQHTDSVVALIDKPLQEVVLPANNLLTEWKAELVTLRARFRDLAGQWTQFKAEAAALSRRLSGMEDAVERLSRAAQVPLPQIAVSAVLEQFIRGRLPDAPPADIEAAFSQLLATMPSLDWLVQKLSNTRATVLARRDALFEALDAEMIRVRGELETKLGALGPAGTSLIEQSFVSVQGVALAQAKRAVDDLALGVLRGELCHVVLEPLGRELADTLKKLADDFTLGLVGKAGEILGDAAKPVGEALRDLRGLRDQMREVDGAIREQVSGLLNEAKAASSEALEGLHQAADPVLRTLRALGDAPIVDALDFNRKKVGYLLDEARKAVGTTPLAAMPARVRDAVRELIPQRLRIPSREMLDKVLPDELKDFDLSKLVPSFAGLELGKMLGGLKMPQAARDNINVTHGFDKQAMRAWLKASTLFKLDSSQTLFNVASLKIDMQSAVFQSTVDVSADRSGAVRRSARGSIRADWGVSLGGYQIVTFRQTTLQYEDGKVDFNISPDKVVLAEVLKFLSDLMEKIGYSDNGFSLALIKSGQVPVGVRALLSLPLPDMGGGTTAVVNVILRAGFELRALNDALRPDFSLAVFLALSSREAPFAITFFILGGSGYIEVGARYAPGRGGFAVYVRLSIYACAMLAVAIGPIKGQVFIGVGVAADLDAETGRPAALSVGAELLMRGAVDVCGIITASITLLLQVRYERQGGHSRLVGRGTLKIRIKICWCFTLKVSVGVTFGFNTSGGSGGGGDMGNARGLEPLPFVHPALVMLGVTRTSTAPTAVVCSTLHQFEERARQYLEMFDDK